jgi:hypothetical protein
MSSSSKTDANLSKKRTNIWPKNAKNCLKLIHLKTKINRETFPRHFYILSNFLKASDKRNIPLSLKNFLRGIMGMYI